MYWRYAGLLQYYLSGAQANFFRPPLFSSTTSTTVLGTRVPVLLAFSRGCLQRRQKKSSETKVRRSRLVVSISHGVLVS